MYTTFDRCRNENQNGAKQEHGTDLCLLDSRLFLFSGHTP